MIFFFNIGEFVVCDIIRTGIQRHPWEGRELKLLKEMKRNLLKTKLQMGKNKFNKLETQNPVFLCALKVCSHFNLLYLYLFF